MQAAGWRLEAGGGAGGGGLTSRSSEGAQERPELHCEDDQVISLDGRVLDATGFCQLWLCFLFLGRLQVAPGGVDLRPWRFQEVEGSPELQNGGLRTLEKA